MTTCPSSSRRSAMQVPNLLFIVELKIWRGDKYEKHGRDQLSSYLATRGIEEGYLVTFDFSKNKEDVEPQWIEWNGKRIFEVIA